MLSRVAGQVFFVICASVNTTCSSGKWFLAFVEGECDLVICERREDCDGRDFPNQEFQLYAARLPQDPALAGVF